MKLEDMVKRVAMKFEATAELEQRRELAAAVAREYKFESPDIVLFVTHPTLSRMPLAERCEQMGITEEQFLLLQRQPGFKRMIQDYIEMHNEIMRVQAVQKLGGAIKEQRFTYTRDGNAIEDFSLETSIQEASLPAKGQAINVQVNVWDRAREKASALQSSSPTVVVSPTPPPTLLNPGGDT